jgi:hypothetical protein
MRAFYLALAAFALAGAPARAAEVIHAFVALADNASQGLVPVPPKIGNGDDPGNNLYWGCSEGVRSWFTRSAKWKKVATPKTARPEILERVVFKHKEKDAWLVADAWRGSKMKPCLETFVAATAGQGGEAIDLEGVQLKAGGDATLLAFIGHNGLMDFRLEWPAAPVAAPAKPKPVVVLCCLSQRYFGEALRGVGARPLLTTTQLMYPGAFILHDATEAWLDGKPALEIRAAAGRAYAKNQSISVKAGSGVFAAE